MYLLDNDQVPYSSHFSKKECACLAIAMNIAFTSRHEFNPYKCLKKHEKNDFDECFERKHTFTAESKGGSSIRLSNKVAITYFHILWDVFFSLWAEPIVPTTDFPDTIYMHKEAGSTCSYYLPGSQNSVKNDEIKSFATRVIVGGFYMAQAIGYKNTWGHVPRMYINAVDSVQVNNCCKKGTRIICGELSKLVKDKINASFSLISFHNECPVIMVVDIGCRFKPLAEDTSLITNGFYGRRVLNQLSLRSVDDEISLHTNTVVNTISLQYSSGMLSIPII